MTTEITARLEESRIWIMAEGVYFCVFVRDGCVAMVPRTENLQGFATGGSTGMSTDKGLAYLVWREEKPMLVGHSFELPAEPDQVERIQQFSADLKTALGLE